MKKLKTMAALALGLSLSFSAFANPVTVGGESRSAVPAEAKEVKGLVVDAKGVPVIGAGVLVKGTTKGTVTGVDGTFALPGVASGTVLEVSCIGYATQEITWQGGPLNVTLADDNLLLDEVVVVGYGTMKKSDLTGSVFKGDISSVRTAPNTNILQSLQGTVPGLSIGMTAKIGGEPSMEVRGKTTINGATSPLLVVDGIIYNGSINDINPSDIESVDVLKDASSKAVYGAKAANGVIMITTKAGRTEIAPKITFSSNWSWSSPTRNFRGLNHDEFVQKIYDVNYLNAYTAESGYTELNPAWDVSMSELNAQVLSGYNDGTSYDWWGNGTRSGHLHRNNVSVTGGGKNVSYFVSGGYMDGAGVVKGDNFSRATVRANVDVKVKPWLKLGVNTFLAFVDMSGDAPTITNLQRITPLVGPTDADGNYVAYPAGTNQLNPFFASMTDDSNKRTNINSTIYALVDIPWVKGLSYRLNYNFNKRQSNHSNFNPYASSQEGVATKTYSLYDYWLLDNILNYSRDFGKHRVNATLVYGANNTFYDYSNNTGTKFDNKTLGYNDIAQALIQEVDSEAWREASVYQMARVAYNYDAKYFFTATIRRDGYSAFAANKKFGIFPSVGLGWTISREPWMEKAEWIDNLKIRASYGVTGNQTSRYKSLAQVSTDPANYNYMFGDGAATATGTALSKMGNSDLKWETTREVNIGVDYSFLKSRLSGTIDYYIATTTDLLWDLALPSMTGFTKVSGNVGKIRNNGFELSLAAVPVKRKDFTWNINLALSMNKNSVVSLLGEDKDGDGREDDLIAEGLFIGESLGTIYNYEVEGIWQLADKDNGTIMSGYYPGTYKIKDQDGDGTITAAKDRVILGHTEPDYRIGLKNRFTYKGFELSFLFNIVGGFKNGYLGANATSGNLNTPGNATNYSCLNGYDYWTPTNTDAFYQQAWLTPTVSATRYQSRNFIRLQDVSFGYTFDNKLLKRAKIKDLKLYVSGKNLLTITKWNGWDPETGAGIYSGSYPVMKSFAFGVELSF